MNKQRPLSSADRVTVAGLVVAAAGVVIQPKMTSKIIGVLYVLYGLAGLRLGDEADLYLNVLYLVTGIVGVYVGFVGSLAAARGFCLAFGAGYLAFGVLGFAMGDPSTEYLLDVGLFSVSTFDHIHHMLLGTMILADDLVAVGPRGTIARRSALRLLAGGAPSGLLVHVGAKGGVAQERAPSEDGATPRENPMLEGLVQSVHPEKVYGYLPGLSGAASLASLYGLDLETYQAIKSRLDANARQAAHELLADPPFGARVDRLPFQPGATVVGVGESDMDDLQSWLEILRHLLELRRPQDQIRIINDGVSGQATTQALRRLVPALKQQPAWIICALGGNDAVRFGAQPIKTQVSAEETARNFAELRHLAATQTTAHWVWVTRWVADEARVAAYPPFRQAQFALRNEDFGAVSDIILRQADPVDPVVDLRAALGHPPDPELLAPDGLHPSLAGHKAIARALVERLTS